MSRRLIVAPLVLLTAASSVALSSCAGEDQMGSAAHRMSVWVTGTSLGQDIGTLVADNARIPKVVANGAGALHAACSTMLNDAEAANTELPSPDSEVTNVLTQAYSLEGTAANDCYDSGSSNTQLLAESRRDTIKAEALFNRVLQRIRAIDGQVPSTTTTVGNSGNGGGIFG
jgi:hypothetical protein